LELALVGAAEGEAEGDLVVGGDEVVDADREVGEGALGGELDSFAQGLADVIDRLRAHLSATGGPS